jgi:dCMP deaminase
MFIVACGIEKVVCERKYRSGADSEKMFLEAGVELLYMSDEIQKYDGE